MVNLHGEEVDKMKSEIVSPPWPAGTSYHGHATARWGLKRIWQGRRNIIWWSRKDTSVLQVKGQAKIRVINQVYSVSKFSILADWPCLGWSVCQAAVMYMAGTLNRGTFFAQACTLRSICSKDKFPKLALCNLPIRIAMGRYLKNDRTIFYPPPYAFGKLFIL